MWSTHSVVQAKRHVHAEGRFVQQQSYEFLLKHFNFSIKETHAVKKIHFKKEIYSFL